MRPLREGNGFERGILLISDHAGFSRDVIARWQMQHQVPEFTVLNSELLLSATPDIFEVAIAGEIQPERRVDVFSKLSRGFASPIYVSGSGESIHVLRRDFPRLVAVPRHDAWLDTLVLVAEEMLKLAEASANVERLEESSRSQQTYATLGKYMVEMRHGFNNALTSVLGNAELLLLESATFSPGMREQLETLHATTLQMHEMMQRFASLEVEMNCADKSATLKNMHSLSLAARI